MNTTKTEQIISGVQQRKILCKTSEKKFKMIKKLKKWLKLRKFST